MTHPLDGARLKIVRAQEHLDSLKAEIEIFLHDQPHEVRSQPKIHLSYRSDPSDAFEAYYGGTARHVLRPISIGIPPIRLSAVIGDVVTNARAALDYIVWELAQKFFTNPPFDITDWDDRSITAFPCDPKRGGQKLQSRLDALHKRGIPTDPIGEIKSMHPDNAGYESLGWLHELVNTDKHRMLLLTIGDFDDVTLTFTTPAPFADLTTGPATLKIPRDLTANDTPLQSDVQMKGEFTPYVTWQDVAMPREPVERTLEQIVETVANVIPRFDRFFTS